ncbi:MAG: hypothetical protein J5871_04485, partial [Bacteroidales bacterium]|nr:hypothetical protein [Bacteroidales bacterium]
GEGRFSSFDEAFFNHLKSLGADAVWYTGIPRHASGEDFVKGNPGSPYAISDYFDTNPYLADDPSGRMEEFEDLVRRTHEAGLKVITDLVPNHVAPGCVNPIPVLDRWDYDWTDTRKVDWSDSRTLPFMAEVIRFWASKGVDGFRCDMVELVPLEAMAALIRTCREENPGLLFISEVYAPLSYAAYAGAGFDLIYDKSGFYDIARAILGGGCSARQLTYNWQRLGPLQGRMLNFLENHDEQRLASRAFAGSPSRGYAAMAVAALFNEASVMLYFGQEAGEAAAESPDGRTSIFNFCHPATADRLWRELHGESALLPQERNTLVRYRDLMSMAAREPFRSGRNYDLGWCQRDGFDPDRHFAFVRYGGGITSIVACIFSAEPARVVLHLPDGESFPAGTLELQVAPWDYTVEIINP